MADNAKRDLARAVREAYQRTDTGDDGATERLFDRLRQAPAPRTSAWWRGPLESGRGSPVRTVLIAAGLLVLVGAALVTRALDPGRAPATPVTAPVGIAPRGAPAVTPAVTASDAGARTTVRFQFCAPGAGRVALVGDFNDWDAAATPMRRAASADCWSVSLPVEHGRHVYGFVVDRSRWLPDPAAPVAPEDGFGTRGSVILVGSGS
jgi:hypothetical protein